MLTLSLSTFSQNATKVIVLDTYNKGGKLRQSTLVELKTNLAQTISETYGFEGVIEKKVDSRLLAEGFADHPRLSEELAKQVAKLSGTPYALMSEASIDNFGYLTLNTVLVNLEVFNVMATESTSINNTPDNIHKGCEKIIKKIISYLPQPELADIEELSETTENPDSEVIDDYSTIQPQQLTSLEAEKVSRHLNRADVCIEMNYIDDAIKEYNQIVEIAPGWANVYMYLGNTYTLKGDNVSLRKAMENYKKFMRLTDDQDLYYEAQDKLSRVEMMTEIRTKEDANADNLVGVWKSDLYNEYSGQPWFIVDISKTPVPNKYQISLSPKSMFYNNIVNTKSYSEVIDGKLNWAFSFQETYIPDQSVYNTEGAVVNYLFGAGSLGSLVGNLLVEGARANDVGYTNIMDFEFIADVNMKDVEDEYYKEMSDKYLEGSCQMKGEHHQAGRNNVDLDTVRECNFLRGDGYYPVFIKVREVFGDYFYGDIKLTDKNSIIKYSPYLSIEEYKREYKSYKTGFAISGTVLSVSGGFLLGGLLCNGLYKMGDFPIRFGNTFFAINGVAAGLSIIGCIASTSQWNSYLKQCYTLHNQKVDEDMKKYSQRSQASVSFDVGVTPTGVGVNLNF